MDVTDFLQAAFMSLYTFALVMVSLYGLHRYTLVFLYFRHRKRVPVPKGAFAELPPVTIQLPMYNERLVAKRIIETTCAVDYPREKLQIQVLDDSTDNTQQIARDTVEAMRAQGFNVEYIHREDRTGFKAGALAHGLATATGEFVTIFDADFLPDPQILQRSIHHFTDPRVCVVQTRWEHLNSHDSLLTRSQAMFLDGHFAIEHVARNRSDRFMSFNGTAGTWRKAAIEDAGGWQHDTLTEDLDLSYRAQLKGWRFVFLPDLAAPAELPPEMMAFKAQQFRWTKGGAQVALKMLPKVLLSKAPLKVKVEAFFHLTAFSLHLYMLILVTLLFPALFLQSTPVDPDSFWRGAFDLSVFTLATMSAAVFYVAGQVELFRDWRAAVRYLPMLMSLGVGMSVSNAKAILEALLGKQSEFVRTPKYGEGKTLECVDGPAPVRRRARLVLPYIEFGFGVYMVLCLVWAAVTGRATTSMPFLVMFAFGFFYVSVLSFHAERAKRTATAARLAQAPVTVRD